MLKVLTWFWKQPGGRTDYKPRHIAIWADMVSRNLSMPHTLACVTSEDIDLPYGVERIAPPGDFTDWKIPTWQGGKPSCFRRLSMFRRDAAELFGAKRFVSMDLDCVVGGLLDPLFSRKEDLVLYRGTSKSRPYNGSMMLIKAGCRPKVYDDFTLKGAVEAGSKFVGSDQAWLAHKLGWKEKVWDEGDGVWWFGSRYRKCHRKVTPRLLFFPGKPKPWDLAKLPQLPFVFDNYRESVKEAA